MPAHLLLATLATIPASALVAVGVLGVLSAGLRRRSPPTEVTRTPSPGSLAPTPQDTPQDTPVDSPDHDNALDDSPRAAAHSCLDAWSRRPREEWRTLGELERRRDDDATRAREVAELILEGVIAHRAEPFDAWLVRDLAQTAWQMAPDDRTVMSPAVEAAARRAVENAALAVLVRDWLPVEDLALFAGAVRV